MADFLSMLPASTALPVLNYKLRQKGEGETIPRSCTRSFLPS